MKFGCSIGIFLSSAHLICRSTDISKYFRGFLRLRDNESRLYHKNSEKMVYLKYYQPIEECNMQPSRWKVDRGSCHIKLLPILLTAMQIRVATVRKNTWKMKFFPGQGEVREFCGWPGKFRKDLKSQGKVREFENKWL